MVLTPRDFFRNRRTPKRKIEETQESLPPQDTDALAKKFGKDLISALGQGDPKNTPKMSEEWMKKQKEKSEEPISAEMQEQIKELFGDKPEFMC